MRRSIIRSVILVGAVLLSACQPIASRETEPVTSSGEIPANCECPPVPSPSEICPATAQEESPPPAPASAPEAVASQPCVMPASAATRISKTSQGLLIVGRVENILLKRDGASKKSLKLKARIDTGAGLSSMNAYDLVEFERDGAPWVRFALLEPKTKKPVVFERPIKRFANIKQLDREMQRRPIVSMSLKLGDIEENLDVTLIDRSGYVYQVLIGRNFIRDRLVVDVSRKFIAGDGLHLN